MWLSLFLFVVGFVFLIKGADILVDGSSSIAKKYKISNLVIGLTIIAFGTSAPELLISAIAAFEESADIAIGNVIGSSISNTLLILGTVALIAPITLKKDTVNKEIPFSLLAVLAVLFLANDFLLDNSAANLLTRGDGLTLLLFFVIFIYYTFGLTQKHKKSGVLDTLGKDELEKVPVQSNWFSVLMIIGGLAGLLLGGEWVVAGAGDIANYLGLSESFISLTLVALGTSLPELTTGVMAARKGRANMAVGGVIGSNIFNFLWVLGASAVIAPISYHYVLNIDMMILVVVTILTLFFIYSGKQNILSRKEGAILVSLYALYIVFLVYRG
ncbi:MAG TPA: calcium/sodium antiporter [Patescibacteria group bacterium]|nr:calcium/sodium antiporter [Patescibacteria group bacterium]